MGHPNISDIHTYRHNYKTVTTTKKSPKMGREYGSVDMKSLVQPPAPQAGVIVGALLPPTPVMVEAEGS